MIEGFLRNPQSAEGILCKEKRNLLAQINLDRQIPLFFAEREGFEPPVPFSTSVFKTDAIDHSAIFPRKRVQRYYKKMN